MGFQPFVCKLVLIKLYSLELALRFRWSFLQRNEPKQLAKTKVLYWFVVYAYLVGKNANKDVKETQAMLIKIITKQNYKIINQCLTQKNTSSA